MSRREQIRMTPEEVEAYLTVEKDLQVASINADGSPHLVTMWFALMEGDICFWTYGRSQKIVNLQRDPRVTVLVATGAEYGELRVIAVDGPGFLEALELRTLVAPPDGNGSGQWQVRARIFRPAAV